MITPLVACATIQDWIDAYGNEEAIEITNLCDPDATTINTTKLQSALNRAHSLINARYLTASDCGRAMIVTACQQLVLWISRYLMDTTKTRPMVEEEYQNAMDFLDFACKECAERCPLTREEIESILGVDVTVKSRLVCYSGRRCRNIMSDSIPKPRKVDILYPDIWRYYDAYKQQ